MGIPTIRADNYHHLFHSYFSSGQFSYSAIQHLKGNLTQGISSNGPIFPTPDIHSALARVYGTYFLLLGFGTVS